MQAPQDNESVPDLDIGGPLDLAELEIVQAQDDITAGSPGAKSDRTSTETASGLPPSVPTLQFNERPRSAPAKSTQKLQRPASENALEWEDKDEEQLSLGQRLLRQDMIQKHVADVSSKVIEFIESDAGAAFVLSEAQRVQQKRQKKAGNTSQSAVLPKYSKFVKKRMLKLARAKARKQAAALFKENHLKGTGKPSAAAAVRDDGSQDPKPTPRKPGGGYWKTPKTTSTAHFVNPVPSHTQSAAVQPPSHQWPAFDQQDFGTPRGQHLNPRQQYALYTNSPESATIAGSNNVGSWSLRSESLARGLDVSIEEEQGLRSYVYVVQCRLWLGCLC